MKRLLGLLLVMGMSTRSTSKTQGSRQTRFWALATARRPRKALTEIPLPCPLRVPMTGTSPRISHFK